MRNPIKRITAFAIAMVLCLTTVNWTMFAGATADTNTETEETTAVAILPEDAAEGQETEATEAVLRQSYDGHITVSAADGSDRNVTVTVEADEGTFPEGASLSVKSVPAEEQPEIDAAVKEERASGANVAASYTFDIAMLDAEGTELQPANGGNVKVSFAMAEIGNTNLDTQIYHIHEELPATENAAGEAGPAPALSVVPLAVETDGETASVSTDGFSYYTVEFTYNELTYVMRGDSAVALNTILSDVGLAGNVTAVEVSDSALISAENEGGTWTVTAHQAFSTTEWMKVTIGGIVYEITVTDDPADPTIVQSGTIGSGVTWELENGKLTIYPTNRTSGTLPDATTSYVWPWAQYAEGITEVAVEGTVRANTSMVNLFQGFSALTTVDLSGLDVSSCSNISGMFENCSSLETLSPAFQTNITQSMTLDCMFNGCSGLKTLDLSGVSGYMGNILSAAANSNFFTGCTALETLNISGLSLPSEYSFTAARTYYYRLDLSALTSLNTVIANGTCNNSELGLLLPEGNWSMDNTELEYAVTYGTPPKYHYTVPTGTSRTISRTQDVAGGFENIADTFYVIDNLSDFSLSVTGYTDAVIEALKTSGGTLEAGDYVIRYVSGKYEIYTPMKSKSDWSNGATGIGATGARAYIYDIATNVPDITITYKNAALDVNGNRHDVVLKIDKFAFTNPDWVGSNGNGTTEYRRYLLTVGPSVLIYRNFIHGVSYSNAGGNQGSGTNTYSSIEIIGGSDDQSLLFYVGDLDVGALNGPGGGSGTLGLVGSEGIILNDGFDLKTMTLANATYLKTYTWDEDTQQYVVKTNQTNEGPFGNYIVGTQTDTPDNTPHARFYVSGRASGSSFIWTSGVNCNTNFLETTRAIQVWKGLPPVSVKLTAQKVFHANTQENESFTFTLTPDSSKTLEDDGNRAMDNYAPQGGSVEVTVTGGQPQTITFPEMTFALVRDADNNILYNPIGTYYYVLKETAGSDNSIQYDSSSHSVKIVVDGAVDDTEMNNAGYQLKVYIDDREVCATDSKHSPDTNAQTAPTGVTFENVKLYKLTVAKTVSGNMGSKAKDWSFSLTPTDSSGNPITGLAAPSGARGWSEATESGTGTGTYSFTLSHGETLTIELPYGTGYTVTETDPAGYDVTIALSGTDTDGTTNTSSATVTDSSLTGNATVTFNNSLDTSPPTGIEDDLAPAYAGLATVTLLLAVLLLSKKKRYKGRRVRHD